MDEEDFRPRSSSSFSVVNVVTVVLIIGAFLVLAALAYMLFVPDNPIADRIGLAPDEVAPTLVPTIAPAPTRTSTPIPEVTVEVVASIPPTNTPLPERDTATPIPVSTLRPTLTPSPSSTLPPPTPTKTPTPTPTNTSTPGPSPTATNTRSAYPFTKDDVSPQYLQNFANAAGCNWMAVGGTVLDMNGAPVPNGQYRVHVWDSGIDATVPVGGAPAYGPSGFEQFLFDAPRIQDHNIQLETTSGTAVSQVYRIQTRASCNQNLVLIGFVQNH